MLDVAERNGKVDRGAERAVGEPSSPVAAERLLRIEPKAVRQRLLLRNKAHRARATHGDFHPFNLLFRQGMHFSVLDRSRGGEG